MKFVLWLIGTISLSILFFAAGKGSVFAWLPIPITLSMLVFVHRPLPESLFIATALGFVADMHFLIIGPFSLVLPAVISILYQLQGSIVTAHTVRSHVTLMSIGSFLFAIGLAILFILINGFEVYSLRTVIVFVLKSGSAGFALGVLGYAFLSVIRRFFVKRYAPRSL